jgi:hypothetical protein
VHDEARSGRLLLFTKDLKDRVDVFIRTSDSLLMSFMKFSHMFHDWHHPNFIVSQALKSFW